jgi:polysaccharide export outer membrane protein
MAIQALLRALVALLCCLPFAGAAIAQERPSLRMSDVLASGTQAARPAPFVMGMKDYRIGAEDLIEIQVFGVDQLSRTVRVNSRGLVSLPLIGSIEVAGLTAQEAEAAVAERLAANFLQNPQVSLFIKEYTTQRVTVEGAVAKPGIYPLRGQTTLLITLALAGGQASLSDMSEVMLFRADASGKRVGTMYDVERIRRGELDDPAVVNDDLIVVNRSRARTVFRDSLLRDIVDTINPFSPLIPK